VFDPITIEDLENVYQQRPFIYVHYLPVLETNPELEKRWQEAQQILDSCFGTHQPITGPEQLQQTVNLFNTLFPELETAKEEYLATYPDPDTDNTSQPLTDADRVFASKQRQLLSSVEPIKGKIDEFSETGTEGAWWSVTQNGLTGYDALHIIKPGNRLVIYNSDGSVLFDEIIIYDTESGWKPRRRHEPSGSGQQCCGALWCHWIQKGYSSKQWEALFLSNIGKLNAELYQQPS
jgi:hypothetical protein